MRGVGCISNWLWNVSQCVMLAESLELRQQKTGPALEGGDQRKNKRGCAEAACLRSWV